jgi:sorting nexin-4
MHKHLAHPPGPDPAPSLLDNISDTFINAFARVRKPDERFLEVRDGIDRLEEGLGGIERLWGKLKTRSGGNIFPQEFILSPVSLIR